MSKGEWISLIENVNFNIFLTFLIEKGYHFNMTFDDSIKIDVFNILEINFSNKNSSYNILIFSDEK